MSDIQTEFERLRRSGDEHYGRKEYSIAAECYRAATGRGPSDHRVYFNLAYSLAAIGKHKDAVWAYEMAIAAGSGAAAHNNLGLCYRKLGNHQEARDEFLKATRVERSDVVYWRNLAACLTDLKDSKAELNALEELSACEGCTADDWNKLGCARERDGDVEGGLIAFRNAASAAPAECAYFLNIALMHDRSGRVLDAYHACRHSLHLKSDYEPAVKMIPRLKTALEQPATPPPLPSLSEYKFHCPHCGQRISASESLAETEVRCPTCAGSFTAPPAPAPLGKTRDIGPHDYVNPYVLLNLTAVSDLPEASEWFDQPEDWGAVIGSLTRRRRALKAEFELNEGRLSWLSQLHITDEVVHRVLSDLDDSGWHPHHWAVFRLPLLNRFLMHGELQYFHSLEHAPYPLVAEIAGAAPDDFEHEEFVSFISPFFRHRWTPAIKQALDVGNYAAASALFATGAPVTAADLDEALEPVRRHFSRRCEALKAAEADVAKRKNGMGCVELDPATRELLFLNTLPRHLGSIIRDDLAFAYRNLGIEIADECRDFVTAGLALKTAERFAISDPVKQRCAKDREQLSVLLRQQIQEEKRAEELTLRLKLKSWFRERTLEITPERFSWNEESISAEQMDGVRYGITIGYLNGNKTAADSVLAVRAANGAEVATDWLGEENFSSAVRSVMGLYAPSIIRKILVALEGSGCRIGQLHLSKQGIAFESGIVFKKQHLVAWADAETEVASGDVQVYSRSDLKARTTLACREHWNACLLPTVIEIMKSPAK